MQNRGCLGTAACWLAAWALLSWSPDAWAQSVEFRGAVEQGHRDRLRDVSRSSSELELLLAEADFVPPNVGEFGRFGHEEEAISLLVAQYAVASGHGPLAMRASTQGMEQASSDAAKAEWQLLLTQGEYLAGRYEEAASRADWLSRQASEPSKGWGLFAQAQCELAAGDTAEALRLFKLSARSKSHAAAAPAHLELGRLYEARSDAEAAMRYLTLYRESYPRGLVPELASTTAGSARADRAAGVEYSIQVGVFGDRANAERLRERYQAAGYKTELVPRTLSGQKYTAVWVGRYRSQSEAQDARRILEDKFSESFRVVVRE